MKDSIQESIAGRLERQSSASLCLKSNLSLVLEAATGESPLELIACSLNPAFKTSICTQIKT